MSQVLLHSPRGFIASLQKTTLHSGIRMCSSSEPYTCQSFWGSSDLEIANSSSIGGNAHSLKRHAFQSILCWSSLCMYKWHRAGVPLKACHKLTKRRFTWTAKHSVVQPSLLSHPCPARLYSSPWQPPFDLAFQRKTSNLRVTVRHCLMDDGRTRLMSLAVASYSSTNRRLADILMFESEERLRGIAVWVRIQSVPGGVLVDNVAGGSNRQCLPWRWLSALAAYSILCPTWAADPCKDCDLQSDIILKWLRFRISRYCSIQQGRMPRLPQVIFTTGLNLW